MKLDPDKVKAIQEMKPPTDVQGLRRFLGLVNYLSKFIPNMSNLLYPLQNLTKQNVLWTWSTPQQDAYDEVIRLLTNAPTLAYYNPDEILTLENDSSEFGIGSMLSQKGKQTDSFCESHSN